MKHNPKNDGLVVVYDPEKEWVGVGYLSVRKVGDYFYATWDNDHVKGESRNEPDKDSAIRKAIEKTGYIPMTFEEASRVAADGTGLPANTTIDNMSTEDQRAGIE